MASLGVGLFAAPARVVRRGPGRPGPGARRSRTRASGAPGLLRHLTRSLVARVGPVMVP